RAMPSPSPALAPVMRTVLRLVTDSPRMTGSGLARLPVWHDAAGRTGTGTRGGPAHRPPPQAPRQPELLDERPTSQTRPPGAAVRPQSRPGPGVAGRHPHVPRGIGQQESPRQLDGPAQPVDELDRVAWVHAPEKTQLRTEDRPDPGQVPLVQ